MSGIVVKDENGFERVAFAEVIIPDSLNVYGDFHTKESVKEFAYGFMMGGFGIDVDHDEVDVSGDKIQVVESFIARPNDPDFIEGSWVVGILVKDDDLWDKILNGEINGFSYQAIVRRLADVEVVVPIDKVRYGNTQPDPMDGHYHSFVVVLDDNERPVSGGTSVVNGHSHNISQHTFTDKAHEHVHIYNYVQAIGEN